MKKLNRISVCFFCIALTASAQQAHYPVKFETIEGVKVVINPDFPKSGRVRYKLKDEMTIVENGKKDEYRFGQLDDLKVSENGMIYVSDWKLGRIQVYDDRGKHVKTIDNIAVKLSLGALFYFDFNGSQHISISDHPGRKISDYNLEDETLTLIKQDTIPENIKSSDTHNIFYQKFYSGDTTGLSYDEYKPVESFKQIVRVNCKTGKVFKYNVYTAKKRRVKKLGQRTESLGLTAPTTIWCVDKEGYLYTCNTIDYMISKFDTVNKELMRFGREYEKMHYRRHSKEPGSSEFLPYLTDRMMFFDGEGNLWVEIQRYGYDRTRKYDIFSPYGIYIKQISLPYTIYALKDNRIYTKYMDHDNDRKWTIKRLRIMNQ